MISKVNVIIFTNMQVGCKSGMLDVVVGNCWQRRKWYEVRWCLVGDMECFDSYVTGRGSDRRSHGNTDPRAPRTL